MRKCEDASCEASTVDSDGRPEAEQDLGNDGAASRGSIADLSLAWMADEPLPRLLVEDDLSVSWLNACARRELARRQAIELRDGALATTSPSLQDKLLSLVEPDGGEIATACIRGADDDGHVVLHSHRLDLRPSGPRFGIRFHRVGENFKPVYAGLGQAFGLTVGEKRVIGHLLDGATLPMIAESLALSVETIRTHVRNIYAKMEVSSRAGMFSLVRAFRL